MAAGYRGPNFDRFWKGNERPKPPLVLNDLFDPGATAVQPAHPNVVGVQVQDDMATEEALLKGFPTKFPVLNHAPSPDNATRTR